MKNPNDDDPQTRDNHATDTNIVASIPDFLQADLLSWLQEPIYREEKMISFKTESAWRGIAGCRHCSIRNAALFGDLDEQNFHHIHAPIDDLLFPQESTIYHVGAPSQGVFTLRTGMIKLVRFTSDGCQRIVRVLRPGDLAGLEVLAAPHYDCEAVALTDVAVCRIPLQVIRSLESTASTCTAG